MYNKRGLSQVVTTVLIILLVLVAVLIIWGFVRPTLEETGEQVGAECLTVDLQVTGNCDLAGGTVEVRRNAGSGALEDVQLIQDGELCTKTGPGTLTTELATDDFTCSGTTSAVADGQSFEVAAIVTNGKLCEPSRTAVTITCI